MSDKDPIDYLKQTDRARARRLVLGGAAGAKKRQELADNLDDTRRWVSPDGYVLSDRIWRARATDRAAIDGILRESLAAGDDPIKTARRLAQYLTPLGSQQTTTTPRGGRGMYAARRLARTETSRAFGQATIQAAKASRFGVMLGWRTSDRHSPIVDNGVCLAHQQGSPYTPDTVPQYPAHPHCFPAGTVVAGPRVVGSAQRWYDGQLVDIVTSDGDRLSATLNHPVLTPQGWVAAGLLCEGDHVVGYLAAERGATTVDPDHDHGPALIEDVAKTLGGAALVTTVRVPPSTEDFHGDGSDTYVSVVRTDGLLGHAGSPALGEPSEQRGLQPRDDKAALLPILGGSAQRGERALASSDGVVGRGRAALALLGRRSGSRHKIGGPLVSTGHAGQDQPTGDNAPRDADRPSDRHLGLTGDIPGHDEIVLEMQAFRPGSDVRYARIAGIARREFSGYVYNLQTTQGWYLAGGIMVHNCRCTLLPIAEDPQAVADQLKAELDTQKGTGPVEATWDNLEQAARGGDRNAAQALLDLAQRNGWISPADASFQASYLSTATKADIEDLVDFVDEGRTRAGGVASTVASKTPVREGFQLPPRASGLKADQIRIQGMSDIRVVADQALDLIDQVHTDGALPRIPVSEEYMRPGAPMGAFQPGKTPDGRQIAVEMRLNPAKDYAQHAKATFVHETGHFMDLAVMGRDGVFGSAEVGGELQAWRRAVEETRAVKALRANRGGTVTGRGVDGLPVTRQTDDRYTDYLLQPEEMWARSYTQYVAERTGDPDLRWSLDQERPGTLSGDWYQAHWTTEDFAPVRAEIDNLFRRRGWID